MACPDAADGRLQHRLLRCGDIEEGWQGAVFQASQGGASLLEQFYRSPCPAVDRVIETVQIRHEVLLDSLADLDQELLDLLLAVPLEPLLGGSALLVPAMYQAGAHFAREKGLAPANAEGIGTEAHQDQRYGAVLLQ